MNIAGSPSSFRLFLAKNVSLRAVVAITMAKSVRGRTTRFQRPARGTLRKKGFVMRVETLSHDAVVREMVPESEQAAGLALRSVVLGTWVMPG